LIFDKYSIKKIVPLVDFIITKLLFLSNHYILKKNFNCRIKNIFKMKKFVFYSLFLGALQNINAQSAGTLDKTFTTTGYASIDYSGNNERANALAIQSDGKIIIVGDNVVAATPALDQLYVARVDATGKKDATFGVGGVSKLDIGDNKEYGRDVIILPDGKILVLGSSFTTATNNNMVVLKLSNTGLLDNTFGTGGKTTVDYKGKSDIARSMAVLSDGKIIIVGESGGQMLVARLTAAGLLDTSFGTGGYVYLSAINATSSFSVCKVLIEKSGATEKIIVVSHGADVVTSDYNMFVARMSKDGVLDNSFGTLGTLETDLGASELFYAAAIQPDGKIVIGGKSAPVGTSKYETLVVRLTNAGQIDKSFGTGGYYKEDLNVAAEEVRGLEIQYDGKIVGVGSLGSDAGIIRLNSNGTPDQTFGAAKGYLSILIPSSTKDLFNAMKFDKSNKIVAVGVNNFQGPNENFVIARINSGLSSVFEADQNSITVSAYPNPAKSNFSLDYELKTESDVIIELYDMIGKKIVTLSKEFRNAGTQHETFDVPNSVNNGIYICRLQTKTGATNTLINFNK
jgi:uncharacterized delta-60 repeat protein